MLKEARELAVQLQSAADSNSKVKKLYREAEELYEQNFQEIADQTYHTTRFLEELRNSSISKELITARERKQH